MEQSSGDTEDSGGIEQVFAHPKIARDLQKLHLAACRVAYSSAITAGALRALLDTGAEVVSLTRQPPSSTYILEAGMPYIHNFHVPEYPGCKPSWLATDSSQNKHFFKPSSKTGVKAAKRAAAKRRRSKKS